MQHLLQVERVERMNRMNEKRPTYNKLQTGRKCNDMQQMLAGNYSAMFGESSPSGSKVPYLCLLAL